MILEPDVEIAQLRKLLEIRTALIEELEDERDAALARAEAAEAEVAALKAQLAAQWRPVTDAPPQSGKTVEIRAHGWYSVANEKWHVYLGGDLVAHPRCAEWRPTPPQEANE